MSKAKPWYTGAFPRQRDKHEPPEVTPTERKLPSKTPRKVVLTMYVKYPKSLTKRRYLQRLHTYMYQSYEEPARFMLVDRRRRKFKTRKAALQALESEKSRFAYYGYTLVNYKIED